MVRYSGVPKVRKSKKPLNDELLDEKYSDVNKEIEEELLQEMNDETEETETEPPSEKKAWRNRIILIAIIVGLTMMLFRLMGRTISFVMFFF